MYDLVSLTTGDVASEEILNDLTHAAESGKKTITELVKKRLGTTNTDFHASLTKRKPKTFSSLYSTDTKLEQLRSKCVKPDRDIFCRIIVSMESGREVNMDELLQKELCAVPLSLATTYSVLRPTNKADLATILQAGAMETELSPSVMRTCTIIDGMALMMNGMLVPMLLTKEPVQSTCVQLTVCGCKESGSQCSTRQCLCRRRGLYCSGACGCARAAWCMNSNDIQETNGEETDLDLDVVVRPPEKSTSTTRSSVCDAQPSTSARVLRAQGRTDRRL
ncbi:hypothetical protein JOQ06_016792 [Pogonophryne albipinna]|uniref:Tesmin/TSO1-like CXC domain-containing protein n=1 Tax=Pogonophryne albipinna TaxID=1090488 RepID=A0AAD6FIK0_9TELE|nr:hypothetical protein JOQ06_016792 [Pogonophryne albipinna]